MTDSVSLKRARDEFDLLVSESQRDKDISTVLKNNVTLEKCLELTYLGYVVQETLRLNPPVAHSTINCFDKDI